MTTSLVRPLSVHDVDNWHDTADVLVIGYGVAGAMGGLIGLALSAITLFALAHLATAIETPRPCGSLACASSIASTARCASSNPIVSFCSTSSPLCVCLVLVVRHRLRWLRQAQSGA